MEAFPENQRDWTSYLRRTVDLSKVTEAVELKMNFGKRNYRMSKAGWFGRRCG